MRGLTFGILTIVDQGKTDNGGTRWILKCRCGNTVERAQRHLKVAKSCGCTKTGPRYHGRTNTKVYRAWCGIIKRCKDHPDYHGRGIKVCDRWKSFQNFYEDMGDPPTPNHSLDRYPDNNGNYKPGNVRWATPQQQARNRRSNVALTFNGETLLLEDWIKRSGIPRMTFWNRLNTLHWPIEKALFSPKYTHLKESERAND